jgi:hypothetical protein
MRKHATLLLMLLGLHTAASAQIVYGSTFTDIVQIDLATCVTTTVVATPGTFNDMCVSPSGLFYGLSSQNIVSLTASGVLTTVSAPATPNSIATSLEWGADGFLYALGQFLWKINPTTGTTVQVGALPAGWFAMGDLVHLNGIYYATINGPSGGLLAQINLTNPSASINLGPTPANGLVGGCSVNNATCPKLYFFEWAVPNNKAWEYDVNSSTWALKCPTFPSIIGGGGNVLNYSFPVPCMPCSVNAGIVIPQTFNLCGAAATFTLPYSSGANLGAGQILRYILFTNQSNPVGSTILQSATPIIGFNPATMTLGQTYYFGTVAGPNLNGNVDLTASCIDFSNSFGQVTWRPQPTVTFAASTPDVCQTACLNVSTTLTGAPPFSLTYQTGFSSPTIITFAANTGVITICPSLLAPPGPATLSAVALSDQFCTCP